MANYSNIAGMAAALALGLGAGVVLAVKYPLIPNEDSTRIEPAPQAVAPVVAPAETAPDLAVATVEKPAKRAENQPATPAQADNAPAVTPRNGQNVQAGDASELPKPDMGQQTAPALADQTGKPAETAAPASGLATPQAAEETATQPANRQNTAVVPDSIDTMATPSVTNEETGLTVPKADSATGVPVETAARPSAISAEDNPAISTRTAAPVALAEPKIAGEPGEPEPQQPALDTTAGIATPDMAPGVEPPQTMQQPVAVARDDAANPAPNPEPVRKANRSGTFKSTNSRLALNGNTVFGGAKTGIDALRPGKPAAEPAPQPGALERNAVDFAAVETPMVGIILIPAEKDALSLEALKKLPFPVTFALPADMENVTRKAQEYRDAGFEVLALSPRAVDISLSGSLSQAQVEDITQQIFERLPQAIGLMDRPTAELQRDRRLVGEVINSFAKTGHGLVTYERGLNPVPRAATEAGVYVAEIYKQLDGNNEREAVMKRFLERAGQLARSKGRIVVLASTRPQTISTLVNWALSPKARGLTMVPMSALMRR